VNALLRGVDLTGRGGVAVYISRGGVHETNRLIDNASMPDDQNSRTRSSCKRVARRCPASKLNTRAGHEQADTRTVSMFNAPRREWQDKSTAAVTIRGMWNRIEVFSRVVPSVGHRDSSNAVARRSRRPKATNCSGAGMTNRA
jgi:hypothetical protein